MPGRRASTALHDWRALRWTLLLTLTLSSAVLPLQSMSANPPPPNGNGCACIYYGDLTPSALDSLRNCSLLVLSPLVKPPSSPRPALGYVSVSTLGGWEPWAADAPPSTRTSSLWGERIYSVCDDRWRRVVIKAVNYVISRGFDGVFLDNLDVAIENGEEECLVSLIEEIRSAHPSIFMMVNRGFEVAQNLTSVIDAILFEDFPSLYNFTSGRYEVLQGKDLAWAVSVLAGLVEAQDSGGPRVYLLAYAPPDDPTMLDKICKIYRRHGWGLPLYIAQLDLQEPGICNPCESPMQATASQYASHSMSSGRNPAGTLSRGGSSSGASGFEDLKLISIAGLLALAVVGAWLARRGSGRRS